jgi:hypothetical protein
MVISSHEFFFLWNSHIKKKEQLQTFVTGRKLYVFPVDGRHKYKQYFEFNFDVDNEIGNMFQTIHINCK